MKFLGRPLLVSSGIAALTMACGERGIQDSIEQGVTLTTSIAELSTIRKTIEGLINQRAPQVVSIIVNDANVETMRGGIADQIDECMSMFDFGRVRTPSHYLVYHHIDHWMSIGGVGSLSQSERLQVERLLTSGGIEYQNQLSMEVTIWVPAQRWSAAMDLLGREVGEVLGRMRR